ncbi:hypothetical protein [Pseudoalteromonas sp. JC3]|uniref:hypothetical protein n=1 Tax=Pseudoalteromonas sp. JC3 TaxID=2810196 RepID=UPI0019D19831|nr:hypothetical protein [Pseudoalteromonas sp. JC3]MBR8841689.1 hypothetical protein [Pseudoalteromonas sp. JC3]WJE07713.1 hypothetical protein QSH61_12510 [Pseudoalteromonas sp. JC3]
MIAENNNKKKGVKMETNSIINSLQESLTRRDRLAYSDFVRGERELNRLEKLVLNTKKSSDTEKLLQKQISILRAIIHPHFSKEEQ